MKRARLAAAAPAALVVALVGAGVAVPGAALAVRAATAESWPRVLGDADTWRLVGVTAAQALASTALALALGLPIAALLAHRRFPGARALRAAVTLPFVLPTVVVGAAFTGLAPASWHATWAIVVAAHAWYNAGLVARIVAARWESIHLWVDDAARTLGAGPAARAATISAPLLRPAIASAAAITSVLCFASYGVVRVLGGPALATLETEVAFRAFALGDVAGAIVIAALQLAILGAVVAAVLPRRRAGPGAPSAPPPAPPPPAPPPPPPPPPPPAPRTHPPEHHPPRAGRAHLHAPRRVVGPHQGERHHEPGQPGVLAVQRRPRRAHALERAARRGGHDVP
ncbi:MAG: ABC transporter permease subunit, partial [Acidimicrobiia bacterium]